MDPHEKVDKIIVLKEEWLVENNLLTPSLRSNAMKLKNGMPHFMKNGITVRVLSLWLIMATS